MCSQAGATEEVDDMAEGLKAREVLTEQEDRPLWPHLGDAIRKALNGLTDLEDAADALLDAAGVVGRAGGIYTEKQLTRKIHEERARLPRIDESEIPPEVVDYLFERQMEELIDASRLSTRQEIVLRLNLCGLDRAEIAAALRCRYQTVVDLLRQARRKLQATYAEGRYAGWYEVYLSEVNRPAYRRRR
jgi:DNA-binding CsgD family transcriptional regulator